MVSVARDSEREWEASQASTDKCRRTSVEKQCIS